MSDRLKDPMIVALVQDIRTSDLLMVDDGHEELGSEEQQSTVELGRSNAEDGEGMLVEQNGVADHAAIAMKMALPIFISQHDVGSAVGAVLIGSVEETA